MFWRVSQRVSVLLLALVLALVLPPINAPDQKSVLTTSELDVRSKYVCVMRVGTSQSVFSCWPSTLLQNADDQQERRSSTFRLRDACGSSSLSVSSVPSSLSSSYSPSSSPPTPPTLPPPPPSPPPPPFLLPVPRLLPPPHPRRPAGSGNRWTRSTERMKKPWKRLSARSTERR